jgi:hypothetical protein
MIGRLNVSKIVVDAILDRKAAVEKFNNIMVNRITAGFGDILERANDDTLSVILSLVRPADMANDPRKTKMMGSMNFAAIRVAISPAGILRPVDASYPI